MTFFVPKIGPEPNFHLGPEPNFEKDGPFLSNWLFQHFQKPTTIQVVFLEMHLKKGKTRKHKKQ